MPMDLTLYRVVGTQNRVALGDLAVAEYYAASKDDDGTIHLKPVNIVTGLAKRNGATADTEDDDPFE